jgi:hypothetical protein
MFGSFNINNSDNRSFWSKCKRKGKKVKIIKFKKKFFKNSLFEKIMIYKKFIFFFILFRAFIFIIETDKTYCVYCGINVFNHSKHCKRCDRCVIGFDHHCKWINNCVGEKNYKPFICMIVSCFLFLCIFILACSLAIGQRNIQ